MSDQGNGEPKALTPEQFDKVVGALNESKRDQQALMGLLAPLFNQVFGAGIDICEEIFPREGRSRSDERIFQAYRQRMLRVGNNARRQAEQVISDFIVHQVYKRETVTKVVAQSNAPVDLPKVSDGQ